mmetsp:Transcript_27522/g.32558  ORF Transcript_27522/g.32558 Transcript_27522/m.32558 type:complete len:118 (-) Transcript_27522:333-686(-)
MDMDMTAFNAINTDSDVHRDCGVVGMDAGKKSRDAHEYAAQMTANIPSNVMTTRRSSTTTIPATLRKVGVINSRRQMKPSTANVSTRHWHTDIRSVGEKDMAEWMIAEIAKRVIPMD